ncbi:MAG TPA: hypothetical protein VK841_06595 [Polyangiaceae bacterium]|jgi:hypothetical protein|nr:hypothetical protein [Polyangiaceae bacterium]
MGCSVCGHETLVETEYRTGGVSARALECASCRAISLDERAARSARDLDSVRQAIAARQLAGTTHDAKPSASPGNIPRRPVDSALNELEILIAEARSAVDIVAQTAHGLSRDAATDVQRTLQRIGALVGDLGKQRSCPISDVALIPNPRRGVFS